MSFLESRRFPEDISYGSRGGPGYSTSISTLASGYEQRNVNWAVPRHDYDAGYAVRSMTKLYSLLTFFNAVRGMAHGFRYKDFLDYRTVSPVSGFSVSNIDCPMATVGTRTPATGDGATTQFQLIKTYDSGGSLIARLRHHALGSSIATHDPDVAPLLMAGSFL